MWLVGAVCVCVSLDVYEVNCIWGWFFFFKQKTAYEVRISDWSSDVCSSDLILMVAPGKTILDTLLEHKISVSFSCSEGICGSCLTAVIDGVPDHRDQFLTDEEKAGNDSIMICCSGARSQRLVLDL